MIYAGQSSLYGGGFAYDGDSVPDIVGGPDRVTFFRRDNGTDIEVFSYSYNSNNVGFAGNVNAFTGATIGQYPGQSSIYSAFYNNTAGNYTLLAGNDDTFLNVPSFSGTMHFRTGNSSRMTLTSSLVNVNTSLTVAGALTANNNLDVGGTALIGWERISAAGTTSTTASTCSQGGTSWTCYSGTATATCSAGKVIVGGGCSCSGFNDSFCNGYPNTTTSYLCRNTEDNASQSFTAYAICARVGN